MGFLKDVEQWSCCEEGVFIFTQLCTFDKIMEVKQLWCEFLSFVSRIFLGVVE